MGRGREEAGACVPGAGKTPKDGAGGDDLEGQQDDPTDHAGDPKGGRGGTAAVYTLKNGTKVEVSQVEHYAHSNPRLHLLTLDEMVAGYKMHPLDKA